MIFILLIYSVLPIIGKNDNSKNNNNKIKFAIISNRPIHATSKIQVEANYNFEIIFIIKVMRCQQVEGMPSVVFSFIRIFTISFIDQCNWNVISEPIMPFSLLKYWKGCSCKQASTLTYFAITFLIVPTISKTRYGTYCLRQVLYVKRSKDISSICH